MLVPTISTFFTPLALVAAFNYQDKLRHISSRRFVAPSFNDVRLILNTSQLISLTTPTPTLQLLTFDGDVTLYDDGASLTIPDTPDATPPAVISRLLYFLSRGICIGIVTAAGYTDASKYHARLSGLLDAVSASTSLTPAQKSNLIVMGGESNFLFVFDDSPSNPAPQYRLRYINRRTWILDSMNSWSEPAIQSLLSIGEAAFESCIRTLSLPAQILRKERAVGIYPLPNCKLTREQLEETVLVVQQVVEKSPAAVQTGIPFTTFNGGSDVFLDIGDKSLGVQSCQKWFGGIKPEHTLHVGDQFLSGGGNDFKARNACTTAWIASPEETVSLLDEIITRMENK